MALVSQDSTPPDLILKGSGSNAADVVLIILGTRQPIEDAIDQGLKRKQIELQSWR